MILKARILVLLSGRADSHPAFHAAYEYTLNFLANNSPNAQDLKMHTVNIGTNQEDILVP